MLSCRSITVGSCALELLLWARHQPTHLGREPRVCTAGRVQMLSFALRWHAPRCANVGAWGKTCAQPLVVSLGRAFPLGPTAGRIGKSGRPHILCFCVLKFVTRYRGVLVMFLCQACRCGRLGASATLSLHPVLIVFLCFEIRIPRYRVVVVMFFSQACRCGRLGASATPQIFQSTLVLFDPKKIEVFFSKKLEVFSLKK